MAMITKIRHTAAVRAAIHTLKVQVDIHQALHQTRQHLPAVNLEVHQERLVAQANQAVREAHQSQVQSHQAANLPAQKVQSQAVQRAVQKRSIMIHMMMVTMTFIWMMIMITTDIIKIQTMQMV